MVLILWAMVRMVERENLSLIYFCINSSVSLSTLAVASSSTSNLLFLRSALARQTSCVYPTEKTFLH
jgi:hypothetical protein